MGTVGIGSPMITVVEKNDVAGPDLLYPATDAGGRLFIPIVSGNRPHYGFGKPHFPSRRSKLRAAKPKRRADNVHLPSGGFGNSSVAEP